MDHAGPSQARPAALRTPSTPVEPLDTGVCGKTGTRRSRPIGSVSWKVLPEAYPRRNKAPPGSAQDVDDADGQLDLVERRHDVGALDEVAHGHQRLLGDAHALGLRGVSRAGHAHALA